MPTPAAAGAHEPKRERGHIRVAAILEAGVEVFSESGYDAATMTEIAVRSGTAIGSLYRFFPSKEALADALLLRYAKLLSNRCAELGERVTEMALPAFAAALVDFMLTLQSERSFALALLDARGGSDDKRALVREAMRSGLGRILRDAFPTMKKAQSLAAAILLWHLLKAVPLAQKEKPALRRAMMAETRVLVERYLASIKERVDAAAQ